VKYWASVLVASVGLMVVNSYGQGEGYHWYKGNTHTHTTQSDGDSTPGLVARWYRNNGYDFLFITDHNTRTEVAEIQAQIDAENAENKRKPFLLIPGEEVSNNLTEEERKLAIHTCGLDTKTTVGKQQGSTVRELLQKSIDGIIKAGGLPSVNHPNFLWSLTTDDLYALQNLKHYEIYNGHPLVNNLGGGDSPGTEEIWDDLLTRGKKYYGVAVDDAHHFKEFRKDLSNPGRGWVMIRARQLTAPEVMKALVTGDFYASSGVEFEDLSTTPGKGIALKLASKRNIKYRTEFFGRDGKLLKTDKSMTPSYELKPDDLYVRARVTASTGDQAWTQPIYLVEPDIAPASTTAEARHSPVRQAHTHANGIKHSH